MTKWKARTGGVIYWLFAGIALLLLASSGSGSRYDGASVIGQVLASAVLYAIGRDMRRVLRE
jgi:hypothetical protein